VSGTFLYLIAALNAVILYSIIKVFREMRAGTYSDEELERQLDSRGLMNRIFGGYARRIDTPWKMYPVGVLFGLGFDTATEVALLVLAGTAVVGGLPFYAVLSLPILFAAGMCLFDTADGCFMNFAYDWAFARPIRKVFYNLTITGLSVFVALCIGTIEILGLIGQELNLAGGFWTFMGTFNINKAGFVIAGIFAVTWAVALSVWHFGKIEQKWDTAKAAAPQAGHAGGLVVGGQLGRLAVEGVDLGADLGVFVGDDPVGDPLWRSQISQLSDCLAHRWRWLVVSVSRSAMAGPACSSHASARGSSSLAPCSHRRLKTGSASAAARAVRW